MRNLDVVKDTIEVVRITNPDFQTDFKAESFPSKAVAEKGNLRITFLKKI